MSNDLQSFLKELMESSDFQKFVSVNGEKIAKEVGKNFANTLQDAIMGMDYSGVADAIVNDVVVGEPSQINKASASGDGVSTDYEIHVSLPASQRMSLRPDRYEDIEDLALLYNEGVDHTMKQVFGFWHSESQERFSNSQPWTSKGKIGSRTNIEAGHFFEEAMDNFPRSGKNYTILDIELDKDT